MMRLTKMMISASLSAGLASAAHADSAAGNSLILNLDSVLNPVEITQPTRMGGNSLTLAVIGEGNGGLEHSWPAPALFTQSPDAGTLWQSGEDNVIDLSVSGKDNFFAVMQTGRSHQVAGRVSGQNNAVAVSQSGQGQRAQFQQHGARNALAISQTAW